MSTTAYLGIIRAAMKAAAADWPKPIATAIDNQTKLAGLVGKLPTGSNDDVMAAVTTALLDGRDPLVDPDVVRLLHARTLTGDRAYGVQRAADERIVTEIGKYVDELVDTLKAAVDATGEVLADGFALLGDTDLADTSTVNKMGATTLTAWAHAKEARQAIRMMDKGVFAIAVMTHAMSSSDSPTLRIADVTLEQYERLGFRADPWDIVRAGATINMATRTTIRERTQRINDEREQRTQRAEAVPGDAYQRTHGIARSSVVL